MSKLVHYLLVFDHAQGELVVQQQFRDAGLAVRAYSQAEREHEGKSEIEIVLIGSDSLDTVRQTHANYFAGSPRSHFFEGLPA